MTAIIIAQQEAQQESDVIVKEIRTWRELTKIGGDRALYLYEMLFDRKYEKEGHWYFKCLSAIWRDMKDFEYYIAIYADGTIGVLNEQEAVDEATGFTEEELKELLEQGVYIAGISDKHFAGVNNIVDAKKLFRKLAKEHHPDLGGDAETFRQIETEYRTKLRILETEETQEFATYMAF